MRKPQRSKEEEFLEEEPRLTMTPMIDVVFQLLIFFMLACRFKTEEGELHNHLPKGIGQTTQPMQEAISIDELRIKLLWYHPSANRPTNDPEIGRAVLKVGKVIIPCVNNEHGETEPDWDRLYAMICRARDNYSPTSAHPVKPVIIDARRQVPFKHVIRALNECVRARLTNVKLAKPEIPY
jgi:biopolymer transport protein ExbD